MRPSLRLRPFVKRGPNLESIPGPTQNQPFNNTILDRHTCSLKNKLCAEIKATIYYGLGLKVKGKIYLGLKISTSYKSV